MSRNVRWSHRTAPCALAGEGAWLGKGRRFLNRLGGEGVLAAFAVALTVACVAGRSSQSSIPVLGSNYAGRVALDRQTSDFVPDVVLLEPGTLKAQWISATGLQTLEVRQSSISTLPDGSHKSDDPWCYDSESGECFTFTIAGSSVPPVHFDAAYGSFVIYAVDVDGDGTTEVAVERGMGRGTSVHVRYFEIYRLVNGNYIPILSIPLNGYLGWSREVDQYPDEKFNPPTWERTYDFVRSSRTKGLDIRFDLLPPRKGVRFVGRLEDLVALQIPTLELGYDARRSSFVIKSAELHELK